jgi:Protein of unknown function (DUF1360)
VTSPARFALASLATWRLTHLLAEEDGPGGAVVRLRARLGTGQLGQLMDCFYCLSVWVAAPFSLTVARRRRDAPLVWLALSGAACLLERATSDAQPPPAADWIVDPGGLDVADLDGNPAARPLS